MSNRLVSLTEKYPFHRYKDSSVIADQYLGNIPVDSTLDNIVLEDENRATFLRRMGIAESDSLYVYNYALDTLFAYRVRDLNLIACLDPFVHEPPVDNSSYIIGLELKGKDARALEPYSSFTYIYIGKENPFVTGGLQPIEWKKVDASLFPSKVKYKDPHKHRFNEKSFKEHIPGETFGFERKGMSYFLRNLYLNGQLDARHLVVVNPQTDSVIFNNVYFGSEGVALNPIRLNDEEHEYAPLQWSGELFKNKPAVLFGFVSNAFGCPWIYFLSPEAKPLLVQCDNRL